MAPRKRDETIKQENESVKVTMTSCMAGPEGVARQGTVLDLPQLEAEALLKGLHARPYDRDLDKQAREGRVKAPDKFDQ